MKISQIEKTGANLPLLKRPTANVQTKSKERLRSAGLDHLFREILYVFWKYI